MKKLVLLLICCFVQFSMFAQDNERLRIAVFDPASSGTSIDEGTKIAVREIISSTIVNTGKYNIVERSLLEKVMQEQPFTNSGAVDDLQATEVGKLAGANKIVLSIVTLTGGRNMVSVKMIDVKTANVERQKVKVVSSGDLLDVVETLTLALVNNGTNNIEDESVVTPSVSKDCKAEVTPPLSANPLTMITYTPCKYDIKPMTSSFLVTEDFAKMNNAGSINIIMDFSDAKINGINMLEYMSSIGALNNKFYADMNTSMYRFVNALKKMKQYVWGNGTEAPVTLVVKVRDIDPSGRENDSDYVFVETSSGAVLAGIRMTSRGGVFGSFSNLLGDAMEEVAAPKLIKYVKKQL